MDTLRVGKTIGLTFACSLFAWSQSEAPAGVPAHIIVTAGHFYSHEPPLLAKEDLTAAQQFEPVTITNLIPLRGDRGALELYILVDDCSSCEVGTKFRELRRFIVAQPETTAVGVAYIQAGRLEIAEKPTYDRQRAINALNPPTGGTPADPFVPLADLIKTWNRESGNPNVRNPDVRRAVLMISNGIDPAAADGLLDPSADAAIEAAELGDVTVFAMYHPGADYASTDSGTIYAGQIQLAHVASESGGEAYLTGFGPLPSLAPFLADVADHLANQYRLEFLARPGEGAGSLQDVNVRSTLPDIDLMTPARAWVSGNAAASAGQ